MKADNSFKCEVETHIGSSFLLTPLANKSLYLKNFMCVPHIIKNLFSISKLTKDNNVVVEFNSESCYVKYRETGIVLLQGAVKDGV